MSTKMKSDDQTRTRTGLPILSAKTQLRSQGPKGDTPFLTEGDLASRWQVSVKTLQNARLKGTGLQFVKLGRAVRYRLSDVESYEAANLHTSTSHGGLK